MAAVWITYAWADNEEQQVEFIAQELGKAGLDVHLDRWDIRAGQRLWTQIERFILQADAWIFVATPASLASEPCKEELAWALDRALRSRDDAFPIIGLFPGAMDMDLIPAAVRTRLFVSLSDAAWEERIKAAAERRAPAIGRQAIQPFVIVVHERGADGLAIEMRPRVGQWAPVFVAIPAEEAAALQPAAFVKPVGAIGGPSGTATSFSQGISPDGKWWVTSMGDPATSAMALVLFARGLPSYVRFGSAAEGGPAYFWRPAVK